MPGRCGAPWALTGRIWCQIVALLITLMLVVVGALVWAVVAENAASLRVHTMLRRGASALVSQIGQAYAVVLDKAYTQALSLSVSRNLRCSG